MMKGYMLFLIACSVHSSAAAVFGDACTDNSNCTETGQVCDNTCVCYTDNYYTRVGDKCVKELGRDCTFTAACNDVNVLCDSNSKCQCDKDTHYDNNGDTFLGGSCIAKHALDDSCTHPASAPNAVQCSDANADCKAESGGTGYTCQCNDGYYSSGGNCLQVTWGTWGDFGTCSVSCGDGTQTRTRTCTPSGATCSPGIGSQQVSCNLGSCERSIGETCTDTSQCSTLNSQCIWSGTKTCTCKPGYLTVGNSCLKRYLGESCSETTHCSVVDNSQCSGGFCECKSDYYKTANGQSGRCEKRHLDESCTADSQCTDGNSECRNNKCLCKSGYYQMGTGSTGTCTERHLDQSCNASPQCQEDNSECSNKICSCKYGYYQTGTGSDGTCTRQSLGDACTDSSQCSTSNAECRSSGTRICQCSNGYYDTNGATSGRSCMQKVYVGSTCPQPTESVPNTATCRDNNARCMSSGSSSYTCQCIRTYYDNMNNNNRQCILRRGLGDSCSDTSYTLDQCSDSSATCRWESGTYKCKCNIGYHQEQQQCVANKALGETCNEVATEAECSNPAAECLNRKCTCNTYSYDNNGQVIGGTCMAISDLQVSNVGFSSIQINKITVTWTIPQNYKQFINKFKVTWRPTNNNNVNNESADLDSSRTSYTMTRGIDPGRAYTVTIISINDQTQQGSSRNTSVVRYQAAKPSITSAIDDLNSDKDISGGTIKVAWNNAPDYKSGYIVKLKDGETVKFTRTVNGVSVTLSSSGLKNGYNYDVTIQAKSEHFDNGKTVLGDIFTSKFKTTPKSPGPPINGTCKDPTDSSISLDWEAPINPNGYLVQYNIHVYKHGSLVFNNVTSTGTRTDKTVGNLELGIFYTFKIYTVNEVGQSTSSLQITSTNCKTKARMSAMPENLQITDVTSRSLLISWDKPVDTFSDENYGYVLQVKDEQDKCKEEVLYRCSDCTGTFPTSKVSGLCSLNKQPDFYKTSAELASQLSYNASLNPYINYIVTVTAINDEGRGHPATLTQRTKEEAPQTPYGVKVVGMTATTFDITWNINGPRPGQTIFVIILTADAPAESKNFTATGFALREYKAFGLQEYWNYSVAVMASTSIGSSKSAVTNDYRTSPAAPGKVSAFSIEPHPDEDFTKMKISWEMPTILERNGVIKSYRFENYEPGNVTATTNFQQNRLGYIYTKTVLVEPEEQYTFKVYAINEQNLKGEHIMVTKMAPPGVPLNIEESLKMDVIDLQREKTVTEKQITITLVRDFFEESTNGKVQTTGLVVCVNSCDFDGVMTITDVNGMENWAGASKKGSTSYRATYSDWLDKATVQYTCGRNKRDVTNIEYIVGNEDCTNVSPDEFCNGPLQPGTSYKFVAFTCTNGGCLLSRQYGPFSTADNTDSHCCECNTTNSQAVIVGVVLGLIIIILLLYAGYATYLIRRYRAKDEHEIKFGNKKDRKSQTYVNETFMTGSASNTSGNFNVDSGVENVYSRLDDNVREDKTTYESLRP